ncbi:MAG: hypothetical protein FWD58_01795 [Firmicutes bacterium]|nr:hypothetical protein [Bacillota bacterium]
MPDKEQPIYDPQETLREFEVYWDDLTPEAQQRLIDEGYQPSGNDDLVPLFCLLQEVDDDDFLENSGRP